MEMQKKLGFTTDGKSNTETEKKIGTEKKIEAEKKIVKKEVDLKPTKSSSSMDHQFFIHPEEAFFLDPSSERPVFDQGSSTDIKSIIPKKSNEIDFAAPIWNFKNLEAESAEDTSIEGEVGPSDTDDSFNLELSDVMKNFVPLSTKIAKDKCNNTDKDSELYVKTAKSIYEEFSKRRRSQVPKQVKEKVVQEVLDASETTNENVDSRNTTSADRTQSIVGLDRYNHKDLSVESDAGLEVVSANHDVSLGKSVTTVKSVTIVSKGDRRHATEFKSKSSSSISTTEATTWFDNENSKSSMEIFSSRQSRPRTTSKPFDTSKSTTSGRMTTFGTKYNIKDFGRRNFQLKSEEQMSETKVESAGDIVREKSGEEEIADHNDSDWIPQGKHEKTNYSYSYESGYVNPNIKRKGFSSTKTPKKKVNSWSTSDEELSIEDQYSEQPLLSPFPTVTNEKVERYEKNSDRYEIISSVEVVDRYEEPQVRRKSGKWNQKRPATLPPNTKNGGINQQTRRKVVDYDLEDYEQYHEESPKKDSGESKQFETDRKVEGVFSSHNARKDTKIPKSPIPLFSPFKENIPIHYEYSYGGTNNEGLRGQYDDVPFQRSHSKSEPPYLKMDRMGMASFTSNDAVEVKMKAGYSFGSNKQTGIINGRIAEKPDVLLRAPVSADYIVALHNSNSHLVSPVTQPSGQTDSWVPGTLLGESRELFKNFKSKEERHVLPEQSKERVNADKSSAVQDSQEPMYGQSFASEPPRVLGSIVDKPVRGSRNNGTIIEIMTPEGEVYNYIAKMSEKPAKELENIASSNHRKNSRLSTDALPI